MSIKYTVVHRRDENNVGDMASNPLQYFLDPDDYITVDITNIGKEPISPDIPLIVGGGGLIGNEFLDTNFRRLLTSSDKAQLYEMYEKRWNSPSSTMKKIQIEFEEEYLTLIRKYIKKTEDSKNLKVIWGAGHNSDVSKDKKGNLFFEYPDYLIDYDITGLRDWDTGHYWAPCASCMHPALRKKHTIKNDIIWFEHKKQLIKDFGGDPIPRFINSGNNIDQTIELLGSANIILTNSYHGAYWGTLLKKRVIVVGGWSTKFYKMRHRPYILDKNENYKDVIDQTNIYGSALDESIAATEQFWRTIQERT